MTKIDLNLDDSKLFIQNFMGGTLSLPMKPKMKILRLGESQREDMTPEECFRSFMTELWSIDKVREIFQSYGAELR